MPIKQSLAQAARGIAHLPVLRPILFHPTVRSALQTVPGLTVIYGRGWELLHPFDLALGTDTSGYVSSSDLPSSPLDTARKHVYAGSQPSIIRAALATLPTLDGFAFVDLGCGRGRPLLVATEFPFREIVGVELASDLADGARANVEILRNRKPGRTAIRVETADASTFPLPDGDFVLFLYNPFGAEVIEKVVANVERALASAARRVFVVYYNPVFGATFDASPALRRYFAASIPYASDELGFGPDDADPVVIWQGGQTLTAKPGADAKIVVTKPNLRSALAASH